MTRIEEEREKKLKWKGIVCPRVNETLRLREKKIHEFITRASGSSEYEVTSAKHSFVVDMEKKQCSCGIWQLGGTPCVHAVCVYKARNKDPRKYVHKDFLLSTWFMAYNNYLQPLRGPVFWTKNPYPAILPPDMRVLPGRPKRCRNKGAAKRAEEAEKQAELKAKKKQDDGVFKASRKEDVMHCKICGGVGHNTRTCPRKPAPSDGGSSSQPEPSSEAKKRKTRASSTQPAPSTREDADL
ncbi:hypothetical protein LIER_11060 [Lithospermum erythrorhizon]|uniref:SWIM-type domain-containing protein n=1 Tax=Lithospermum erythrorhizon TaxID=34254 RepID=A0AAV3PR00_LITER